MTGPRDTVSQAASITPVTAVAYYLHPPRFKYHLTEAGRELFPVLLALQD
jgi:DNA-binding HxlR family transcriptional regulator